MAGKRKRGEAFSAHEKLVHKSCALLQREAKKVRVFLVRKAVQQLKQLRQQQQETPALDAAKRQKRELKLRHSVARFEREHAALKALDLQKLLARARLLTGLHKPPQAPADHEHEETQEWDEEASDSGSDEEQHENVEEQDDQEQEPDVKKEESVVKEEPQVKEERPATTAEEKEQGAEEQSAEEKDTKVQATKQDDELEDKLLDRVLAHKQIVPLLDAIKKLVEKEEKEAEKKRRAQEKRALKRGRHESLVGNTGRSGVAPSSLFLGSLSGRGGMDELDMGVDEYGTMAGADDDIAEFLGEKKKRKNRPGQMARRMKAIRKEEAAKRKEDRAKGIFVPYKDNSASVSKYGPSERPKKAKPKAKPGKNQGDKQQSRGRAGPKEAAPQKQRAAPAPAAAPVEAAHPSWLAKQKQKEKEKISLTAFSGKKITFD